LGRTVAGDLALDAQAFARVSCPGGDQPAGRAAATLTVTHARVLEFAFDCVAHRPTMASTRRHGSSLRFEHRNITRTHYRRQRKTVPAPVCRDEAGRTGRIPLVQCDDLNSKGGACGSRGSLREWPRTSSRTWL